jgi:hypothetical protein
VPSNSSLDLVSSSLGGGGEEGGSGGNEGGGKRTRGGEEAFPSEAHALARIMEVAIRSKKRRRSTSEHGDRLAKKKRKQEREEEASVATAMERLASNEFPTELLWKIIGLSLRSGIGRCDISVHDKPLTLRSGGLAWPKTLSLHALRTIRKAVAKILPEWVILEMSAEFQRALSGADQPRLVIPRALKGSENRVRNLVLNLDLNMSLNPNHTLYPPHCLPQLATATAGIETVAKSFPNLQTCVLVVYVGFFDGSTFPHTPQLVFPPLDHIVGVSGTLKAMFLDLVDAFAKRGPGRRRLVRFECQQRSVEGPRPGPVDRLQSVWKVLVGPLVRVDGSSDRVVNKDASDSDSVQAVHLQEPAIGDEASPRSEVECLFHQAYRFKRETHVSKQPPLAD